MNNVRALDKRLTTLESQHGGSPILVLLCAKGEASTDRVARWEQDNGPIGERNPIVVSFVDAQIERDL